jgi:hypothetical protein
MKKYQLVKPAIVIRRAPGRAVVAPVGSVITVPRSPPEDHRLVDVEYLDTKALMFVADLFDRAVEIAAAA